MALKIDIEKYKKYTVELIKSLTLEELNALIDTIKNDYETIEKQLYGSSTIVNSNNQLIEGVMNIAVEINKIKNELFERVKNENVIEEKIRINETLQYVLFIKSSLDNLLFDIKIRYNNFRVNDLVDGVHIEVEEKIKNANKEIESKLKTLNEDITNKLSDFNKTVDDKQSLIKKEAETQIFEAEKKVFNNSMTYMTILAALIAIIASVISTSSTWLNSANNSSVVLAFVVPSLVLLVAIIFLLSFSGYLFADGEREKQKRRLFFWIFISVSIVIVLFSIIVLPIIYLKANTDKNDGHIYYIIDSDSYQINDDKIEFSFDGVNYSFTYEEKFIYDGKLKYCVEHNELE